MGKKQHQSDKLYLTTKEWSTLYGGHKAGKKQSFERLPYDCCALTFQPFDIPMCSREGVIYDLSAIVPFLKKYGVDPANGKKIKANDLVRLEFHANNDGKKHCPVTRKIFNQNSHIVANAKTGNVYSHEAVDRFNVKAKHWFDLITDEEFKRADIITIQDPMNVEPRNLTNFFHLQKGLKVEGKTEKAKSKLEANTKNIRTSSFVGNILKETYKSELYNKSMNETAKKKTASGVKSVWSNGATAMSLTSTVMGTSEQNTTTELTEDELRYQKVKNKAYVRVTTNFGDLNFELYCEQCPRTCDNFMRLCAKGYYDKTIFHRSIKNFMIQGGDPTGTGRGGESIWGKEFKDEFMGHLKHNNRGILSMANSGPNTNKSQFFILYRPAPHLDRKHSVFGSLVGGMEVLNKMEKVKTDGKDVPTEVIKILSTTVFENPFDTAVCKAKAAAATAAGTQGTHVGNPKAAAASSTCDTPVVPKPVAYGTGVGKYIKKPGGSLAAKAAGATTGKRSANGADEAEAASSAPVRSKKMKKGGFGSFGSW